MTPPAHKATAYSAIRDWIEQPPALTRDDYVNRDATPAAQARQHRDYEAQRRRLGRQLDKARQQLAEFNRHDYSADRLSEAAAYANSGRLQIDNDGAITYEAAQDERREYRAAATAVLADYNRQSRRAAYGDRLPPEPTARDHGPTTYRITPPAD